MRKQIGWLLMLIWAAVWMITPASAQTELRAIIGALDITEFPQISTILDVRGPQGYFIEGLTSEAVLVYEDEQPVVASLTEVRPGAQVVVAYGGGDSFNIRTLEGAISRYDLIRNWLLDWAAESAENGLDDLSLVVPQGILISHEVDPLVWAEGLQTYSMETAGTTSLEVLSAAIDLALESTPMEGMGRSVIFVSDVLVEAQIDTFHLLIDRAEQGGVRVNIGMIGTEALFGSDMAQIMQAGAAQTHGQFFAFSSDVTMLPDLSMIIESSRRAYALEYRSIVRTAGMHTVYVVITTELGDIRSQTLSYESVVVPPVPVFVSPPTQIVRAIPQGEDSDLINLAPDQMQIGIQVDFPDSILREVSRSVLYVNGEVAAENLEPPYDIFTIDLTPYQESVVLALRAEVTDELGLSGNSADILVEVVVQQPSGGLFSVWGRNASIIAGGVVLLSGSVLLLVLVLAGRLRPRRIGERRRKRSAELDPVTQPVELQDETTRPPSETGQTAQARRFPARLPWQQRPRTTPFAYLVQVNDDGQIIAETEYPITSTELTFGSDPAASVLTLKDPAVEPLHARVWRDAKGKFWIADLGSVAGTWLNYAPVSTSGSPLEHGDLVHVAKQGYRFTLSRPTRPRRTVVTPLEDQPKDRKDTK